MDNKAYLGDSVYVEIERGMLKLTTENGLPGGPSNTIFLEPEVFGALARYVDQAMRESAALAELKAREDGGADA